MRAVAAALTVSTLLASGLVRADERTTSAEELFVHGRAAMDRGDLPRACELLEASLKQEDTLGTLLNVAICHEKLGRLATAWGEFRAVEQRALRSIPPATARATFAHEHAEALRPRLAKLRVMVDPRVDTRQIEVRVDGVVQSPELWELGFPADAGERRVRASAPGKIAVELKVNVVVGPTEAAVTIPPLEDAPVVSDSPMEDGARALELLAGARARRTAGFVTGGVGLAFVAAGATFGALALAARSEANGCGDPCYSTVRDSDQREVRNPALRDASAAYDRGTVFANLSTGAFALGAVGVGVGLYLVLTSAPRRASAGAPALRLHTSGAAFEGTF